MKFQFKHTKTASRCACGKQKSKHSDTCRKCHQEYMDKIHAEVQAIVDTNTCPTCGASLIKNNALFGWWQCSRYAHGCSWQGFTE